MSKSSQGPRRPLSRRIAGRPPDRRAFTPVHPSAVRAARAAVPAPAELASLGELFKLIGDPSRLAILHALADRELCVCELAAVLGMSESAVSHQLAVMRRARLAASRRSGRTMAYRLSDHHVRSIVDAARVHLAEWG